MLLKDGRFYVNATLKSIKKLLNKQKLGHMRWRRCEEFFHLMDFLQDFVKHRRLEIHSVKKLLV